MADLNNNGIEDELEELSAEEAFNLGLINADGSLVPPVDSDMVAQVPGIENIRNPGAFNPANMEPVEQVGPPTTIGESISQTYNESVLADLINRGFGQEAFQSKAPDGTPTYSIYNKRFGTLGSQVPYSEAGPEAKLQAMNFMLGTGGQERPLPETPTSPVRTPEQVQSILDEQRAAPAPTEPAAPTIVSPTAGAQEQGPSIPQGSPGSPQANFAARMATGKALTPQEIQDANALAASMGTTFNPATGYSREAFNDSRAAPINPPMTGMRPIDSRTGEPLSQQVIDTANRIGLTLPEASVPLPQTPQTPQAQTYSQEETLARLGGRTLNEYLNAPPVRTPGISGLKTDPQGRMIPNVGEFQPQTNVAQPPVAALSSFEQDSLARQQRTGGTGSFEGDSLARQQRIGGTGSFEGDSLAREARLRAEERQPGETQTQRDTRVAKSRTTGGQTQGLSFDDARRRAKGQLAARGVKGKDGGPPDVSMVNDLARGIQAGEPERLANLETERAINESRLIESKSKMNFEPRLIDVGGERAMELSPGYFQRIAKDKPNKTGLQTTLGNLQDDLKSGRLTKEQHDIAVGNAKNIYIGLKEPKQNEIDVANKVAKLQGEAMGATPIEGTNTSGRPTVNSQEEYDALEPGTAYVDSYGEDATKP